MLMDQAGDDFLAGAALAQDQDRNVHVGDQLGLGANLPHGRAGGHEKYIIAQVLNLSLQGRVIAVSAKTLLNHCLQVGFLEGLGEIVLRAQADGLYDLAGVGQAGQHDDLEIRVLSPDLLQGFQSIHSRA